MTNLLKYFRAELIRQDRSIATIRNYINDVQLFARWLEQTYDDEFEPSKIVQRDIIEYRSYLINVNVSSPATVNRRLASLSSYFKWCLAKKHTNLNPVDGVKGIAIIDPGPKSLDTTSLRRLLREVHVHGNARDIAILEILAGTALRVGELVSLKIKDIDIGELKGTVNIHIGKGRASRQVPLNVDVRKALKVYLDIRPSTTSEYLFVGQRGDYMTGSGIWRIVKKYAAMAGIDNMTVHRCRHTMLTRLVREFNCDLATVAKISGHRDLKTLLRYAQPTQDDLAAAVEKLAFTDG